MYTSHMNSTHKSCTIFSYCMA